MPVTCKPFNYREAFAFNHYICIFPILHSSPPENPNIWPLSTSVKTWASSAFSTYFSFISPLRMNHLHHSYAPFQWPYSPLALQVWRKTYRCGHGWYSGTFLWITVCSGVQPWSTNVVLNKNENFFYSGLFMFYSKSNVASTCSF